MAANNLRIIYKNLADTATVVASSTSSALTAASNMKLDAKSQVWRSTGNTATLTVTFTGTTKIGAVILPFCNLSSSALITVALKSGATTTFTTGAVLAAPYQSSVVVDTASIPAGANGYSYGGGTYARVWFTPQTCSSLTITISDSANTYIELSRLIVGDYWSPTYNTSYGLTTQVKDLTTQTRTESGDLISNRGTVSNSISLNLDYLTIEDRSKLLTILKNNGMYAPLFLSVFPDNSDDYTKELGFQIYGKLSQLNAITHPYMSVYTSTIDIDEI